MALFKRKSNSIVCRQAVELVTDYLEDALPASDRARFEAHLADCPHCTEYLAQIRATIVVMGEVEPEALDPRVQDELVGLYRRWKTG